jgi:hypothetical protein
VLDEYVGAENPVRFLDVFVASLDLAALGFQRATPSEIGRPSYHPGDLLRLYLYGYLHRLRSSRKLEQETHRNVELIWLLRWHQRHRLHARSPRPATLAPAGVMANRSLQLAALLAVAAGSLRSPAASLMMHRSSNAMR